MPYFYTPIVDSPEGQHVPAKDDGGTLVDALEDLVGGVRVLKYDASIPRYVLDAPDDQPQLDAWTEETAEEVNIDYPGLVPVGG
jgi:hypothetical protein